MGQSESKEKERPHGKVQNRRPNFNSSEQLKTHKSRQPSITKEISCNQQAQIPIINKPFSSRPSLFPTCNTEPTITKQQEIIPQIRTNQETLEDRSFTVENSLPKQKIIKNSSATSLPKQKPIPQMHTDVIKYSQILFEQSSFVLAIDLTDQVYPTRFSKPRPTNPNNIDLNQNMLQKTKKPEHHYDLLNIRNYTPLQNFSNKIDQQNFNINQFYTDTQKSNPINNQKIYPSLFKSETTSEIRYPYCSIIDKSVDSDRGKKKNISLAECYLSRRNTSDKENHYESIYSRQRSNNHIKNTKSQNNLHRFKEDEEDSREWVIRVNSRSKAEQLKLRRDMMSYGRKPSKANTDTNSSVQENRGVNTTIYSNTIKEVNSPILDRLVNGVKAKIPEKEMFALTKKNYYNLPEVKQKLKEEQKKIEKSEFLKERKNRIKELDKEIKNRLYKQRV